MVCFAVGPGVVVQQHVDEHTVISIYYFRIFFKRIVRRFRHAVSARQGVSADNRGKFSFVGLSNKKAPAHHVCGRLFGTSTHVDFVSRFETRFHVQVAFKHPTKFLPPIAVSRNIGSGISTAGTGFIQCIVLFEPGAFIFLFYSACFFNRLVLSLHLEPSFPLNLMDKKNIDLVCAMLYQLVTESISRSAP